MRPANINTLRAFLYGGGKLWLFGDGSLWAILLGEQNVEEFRDVKLTPIPGMFLYDYLKCRSPLEIAGRGYGGGVANYLTSAVPHTPASATPGRPWPYDSTRVYARGPCDDPRVGPASGRALGRWGDLPCLTLNTDPTDWSSPLPTNLGSLLYVSGPITSPEDVDPGPGIVIDQTLDTLYLQHSQDYWPSLRPTYADGKPMMLAYWGPSHGTVVWTGLPLWMFHRDQVRALAVRVLTGFGMRKDPNPATWEGPGSAHLERSGLP
jgi:hypothetical protein